MFLGYKHNCQGKLFLRLIQHNYMHLINCVLYFYTTQLSHLWFFQSISLVIYFSQTFTWPLFFFWNLQLTFLDMIMYIIFKECELPVVTVRWTRVFRPLFLTNISEGRQLRRAFRNIRKTLPDIANVLVLLLLLIGLFSLLGTKLFGKRKLKDIHGNSYFTNYWDVYFRLYVLTTTANNPDVMWVRLF